MIDYELQTYSVKFNPTGYFKGNIDYTPASDEELKISKQFENGIKQEKEVQKVNQSAKIKQNKIKPGLLQSALQIEQCSSCFRTTQTRSERAKTNSPLRGRILHGTGSSLIPG